MKTSDIEKLHSALSRISNESPLPVKFRIGLFLNSVEYVIKSLNDIRKEVPESVSAFETKKKELLSLEEPERTKSVTEHMQGPAFEEYRKIVQDFNDIYTMEIDIKPLKLSIDDIPDDLNEYSPEEVDLLFSLIE
jgi:hypothetical protein